MRRLRLDLDLLDMKDLLCGVRMCLRSFCIEVGMMCVVRRCRCVDSSPADESAVCWTARRFLWTIQPGSQGRVWLVWLMSYE